MLADSGVFGADLLVWLVLALGAAMVVGYGTALLRPPDKPSATKRPGVGKTVSKGGGAKGATARRPATGKGSGARGSAGGRRGGQLAEAPRGRSFVMIGIGAVASIWSLATLIKR